MRDRTFRNLFRVALRRARLRSRRLRDERGSAAVEFAFIAPLFFLLMFVIAETALIFIAEQVMDNAVFETARLIRTGQVQEASMSKADFTTQVCNRVSVFINCGSTDFYLDVKSYETFGDMVMSNPTPDAEGKFPDAGTFAFGEANDIVMVRAYYQWPTSAIPFVSRTLATPGYPTGKRLIGSFAAFRNEPFTAVASN